MPQETGRLIAVNSAGAGSIAVMQTPHGYVPWFEVIHELNGMLYTFGDVADVISMAVGVCVVTTTVRTIMKAKK